MSEFTDGLLILKAHVLAAQVSLTDLDHPYIIKHLNDHWSVITFEAPNPEYEPVYSWILKTSQDMPMLYFQHAEDHGWGYRIYQAGEQKAAFAVDYGIAERLMQDMVTALHPGIDVYENLAAETIEDFYKQVHASEEYPKLIAAQYAQPGLEHFALFGLSPEKITQLREILTPERYTGRLNGVSQVEAFQQVVGIEEMSWVSYHYLSRDAGEEDLND